jgi:hypothetical protein
MTVLFTSRIMSTNGTWAEYSVGFWKPTTASSDRLDLVVLVIVSLLTLGASDSRPPPSPMEMAVIVKEGFH